MGIIYNERFRTHHNDFYDGLVRLAGMTVFALSVFVFTVALYNWGMQ